MNFTNFNEEKFSKSVSNTLKFGILLFIVFSILSIVLEILGISFYKEILKLGIFILIITPLLRILILFFGFLLLKDFIYSFYSFLLILIVILEFLI